MIEQLLQKLEAYKDAWDIITQKDLDGGDSLQRNSHYWILRKLSGINDPFWKVMYKKTMDNFEIEPGVYMRHPNKNRWYSNPKNCSRDQLSIAILSMVACEDKPRLKRVALDLLKRFGFHRNIEDGVTGSLRTPDIIVPAELASILRGLNWWLLYPIITVLDIGLLLDLLFRKKTIWDYDNMLASQILIANYKYPTLFSWLSKQLYKRTDYKERISNYYSEANGQNGIEPLGELYNVINERDIG